MRGKNPYKIRHHGEITDVKIVSVLVPVVICTFNIAIQKEGEWGCWEKYRRTIIRRYIGGMPAKNTGHAVKYVTGVHTCKSSRIPASALFAAVSAVTVV
jgi:hypothetical protein